MVAIWVILTLIIVTMFIFRLKGWFFKYIQQSKAYSNVACPSNKLPLLGNILSLPLNPYLFSKKLETCFEESKDGDLYCLWICTYPIIAFFHANGLEVFFANSKNITKSSDYNFLHPWLRTGLLTSSGSKWKNRRRIITPAFHDKDLLNSFVEIFNEQTAIFVHRLASIQKNQEVNLYPYIASCALDIICEAAMGFTVGAQAKQNSQYVDAIVKITDILLKRQRMPWLWTDPIFRLTREGREHERCLEIIHQFTKKVIHERAAAFKADQVRSKRSAFLDVLLKQMHDENLTLLDIQEEVDTFMFEGHDTTAAGINFTAFMIASHPEVQQKLHDEIDRVFGDDCNRPCTIEDLNELEYLECVIKETLRLFPSVPFIGREVQEDFYHNNTKVLRGTTAVLFIYFLHRDPKQFPDPERFDPDRFLPENSSNRSAYAYIPFSAGSRNCIGQRFAMLEEKVMLSWLLRKFHLKTSQTPTELHVSFEIILRPDTAALIQLETRT